MQLFNGRLASQIFKRKTLDTTTMSSANQLAFFVIFVSFRQLLQQHLLLFVKHFATPVQVRKAVERTKLSF